MNKTMIRVAFTCVLWVLFTAPIALTQDKPSPNTTVVEAEAKKGFERLKNLTGSWQGTIMSIPINVIIRPASSGSAVLLEMNTDKAGPPKSEITMFYVDGDDLIGIHYCDAGNRAKFQGKMAPDGKRLEFSFLEVAGSTRGGVVKRMVFTSIDATKHFAEFTFIMPNGQPVELRGEFGRIDPNSKK